MCRGRRVGQCRGAKAVKLQSPGAAVGVGDQPYLLQHVMGGSYQIVVDLEGFPPRQPGGKYC